MSYRNPQERVEECIQRVMSEHPGDSPADDTIERPEPKELGFAIAMAAELIVQRPDFREMREMLRAMQAGELTVSRGIEILDMWHEGNWNDNMLPPVRHDLIEEDSMPVEIIDRISQERDAAWKELREIREAIGANAEESTLDEVLRVVTQRDALLVAAKAASEKYRMTCGSLADVMDALDAAIASVKGGAQ